MESLIHVPEASFSSKQPRFLGTILRIFFIASLFWLLGRIRIILSQWIIYSEAFSKSEDLLSASADLLGKFALWRTANTKRTQLRSVHVQQQRIHWNYMNSSASLEQRLHWQECVGGEEGGMSLKSGNRQYLFVLYFLCDFPRPQQETRQMLTWMLDCTGPDNFYHSLR